MRHRRLLVHLPLNSAYTVGLPRPAAMQSRWSDKALEREAFRYTYEHLFDMARPWRCEQQVNGLFA
jgi:hypothetical protein